MCKFVRRLFIAIGVMAVLIFIITLYLRGFELITNIQFKKLNLAYFMTEFSAFVGYLVCELHV